MVDRRAGRIELGPDDGLPDVLLRLKATRTDHVVLAVPESSGLFLTATEFRTLVATADGVRIKVAIETNDRLRQQLASMFGLESRPYLTDEQHLVADEHPSWPAPDGRLTPSRVSVPMGDLVTSKPWRDEAVDASSGISVPPKPIARPEYALEPRGNAISGQEDPSGPGIGPKGVIGILAGILAALILAGALSVVLRTAEVTVLANRQPVSTEITVGYSIDGRPAPGAEITLPANEAEFTVPFVAHIEATGMLDNQGGKASGTVDLRNISGERVRVPASTQLDAFDGTAYITTVEVDIPQGTAEGPGEAQVAIEAVSAGAVGNREAGTLTGPVTGIEGVYFANVQGPVTGGSDVIIRIVTEEDLAAARTGAAGELTRLAASYRLSDGRIVIPSSVQPVGEPSIENDHAVGEQVDAFSVSAQGTFRGLVIDPGDLPDEVESAIRAQIMPLTPDGFVLTDHSIVFSEPAAASDGQPLLTMNAAVDATQRLTDDQVDAVRDAVAGESVGEARAAIAAMPGMELIDISVTPSLLVKSLPGEGRIEVRSE